MRDQPKKVALAHDFLNQWGGGERVLTIFREMYPKARVKTIAYDPDKVQEIPAKVIDTSLIQGLPGGVKKYKWYLPLMPYAVEHLDFSDCDLVVSDSSGFIKGIKVPENCLHVCYIHTSTRYLTVDRHYFKETAPRFTHPIVPLIFSYLRRRDYQGAQRPHVLIANSKVTAERVAKYYKRTVDAVIFPPADTRRFYKTPEDTVEDYYLVTSRLVPYKRIDLAIQACNTLRRRLVIIGAGPEEEALRAMAGPTVEFRGKVSDEELRQAYARCRALIFTAIEDAGMTPLETMACGRPVIAYGEGGVLESVVEGKTGIFFPTQDAASVVAAIERFEQMSFDSEAIIAHARTFGEATFKEKIATIIAKHYPLEGSSHKKK